MLINNIIYKVDSCLNAIDLTFQSFFALNVEYPVTAYNIWIFIQRCLYGIELKIDKTNNKSIKILMSDINNYERKNFQSTLL